MSAEPVLSTGDVERLVLDTCTEQSRSMSGPALASQERPYLDFKLLIDPPLPSATITDLCNEPLFYSGYMSEEEDMSSDAMSFSSGSAVDDLLDDLEFNFPELLAEDCTFVEQQCNHAEMVTLVSPGKAKIVRVSKVVSTATSMIKRPSSSSSRPSSSSSRMSVMSLKAHGRESSVASGSSWNPSTPPLEAGAQTPSSSYGPDTPETPESSFFNPMPRSRFDTKSPTPAPKLRVRNPHRLKLPHMSKRSDSDVSVESFDAPLSAPMTFKSKMMARGAGERTIPLDLPPFPRDQIPQPPKSARPWVLRKDSFGLVGKDQHKHKLRRADSGILPSWR